MLAKSAPELPPIDVEVVELKSLNASSRREIGQGSSAAQADNHNTLGKDGSLFPEQPLDGSTREQAGAKLGAAAAERAATNLIGNNSTTSEQASGLGSNTSSRRDNVQASSAQADNPASKPKNPSREQANAAKWAKRLGDSTAGRAKAEEAARLVEERQHPDTSEATALDRRVKMTDATAAIPGESLLDDLDRQAEISEMTTNDLRRRVEARNKQRFMDAFPNRPDIRAQLTNLNARAENEVQDKLSHIMSGKDENGNAYSGYGSTREARLKAADAYEAKIQSLTDEGMEYTQAALIADLEDPAAQKEHRDEMIMHRENSMHAIEARKMSRKDIEDQVDRQMAAVNEKRRKTIMENGIFSQEALDQYTQKQREARGQAQNRTDNDSNIVPLSRRNIDDPASRAQMPPAGRPSLRDRHEASRAQRSQEKQGWFKRHWKKLGAAALLGTVIAVGIVNHNNNDNNKAPDAPAAVQPDAPDMKVTAVELDSEKYPTPFDLYVHEHGGDTAAAMAALNADADASINKNELRKVYLPETDNYGDAKWMLVTPAGDTSKRMVVPPLASHTGGVEMALDAEEEDKK